MKQLVVVDADEGRLTLACDNEGVLHCEPMQHLLVRENRPSSFVHVVTASRFRPVAVELSEHATEPPVLGGFEDVVEFSVETSNGLALVISPEENWLTVTDRVGDLRVRVHVRGRDAAVDAQDEPDSGSDDDAVLEAYAIQVWPAPKADLAVVHVKSADAASLLSGPPSTPTQDDDGLDETEERTAAGIAAGNWVGSALTQPIADQHAAVSVRVYLPGTPRKMARRFGNVCNWLGGRSNPTTLVVGGSSRTWFESPRPWESAVAGNGGYIKVTYSHVDLPRQVVAAWNWHLPRPVQPLATHGQGDPVLPTDTTLQLHFEPVEGLEPRTRMTLHHSGLPENWTDAMGRFWSWQLSTLPRRSTYR